MSAHTYTPSLDINGEFLHATRDDQMIVGWNDADFKLWNAAQNTPIVLSARQQAIARIKAAVKAGTTNSISATDRDLGFHFLIDRLFPELS